MIKQIAKKCRKVVELAVEEGVVNADSDLAGACAIASYFLRKKLLAYGYKTSFYVAQTRTHCWLMYRDKILDITATQFGHPNKVVYQKNSIHEYFYEGYKVNNFKKEFSSWRDDQQPSKEIIRYLNDLFHF